MRKLLCLALFSTIFQSFDSLPSTSENTPLTIVQQIMISASNEGFNVLGNAQTFATNELVDAAITDYMSILYIDKLESDGIPLKEYIGQAAEKAAKIAAPIVKQAIQQMTIQDTVKIIAGGSGAATKYLKEKTKSQLIYAIQSEVQKELEKNDALKLIPAYNVEASHHRLDDTFYKKKLSATCPSSSSIKQEKIDNASKLIVDGLFYVMEDYENKQRNSTIANSSWLKIQSYNNPGRWAVDYPSLYITYSILNDVKPKSILGFGLGESTMMTYQYASNHVDIDLNVIEESRGWVDDFVQNKLAAKDVITILPTQNIFIGRDESRRVYVGYVGLMDSIKGKKFDLVIIDGYRGNPGYSRYLKYFKHQIVDIIDAGQLEDSFIILIEDERVMSGQDAIDDICIHLRNVGKKFCIGKKDHGTSESVVICSPDYQFLFPL